MLNVVIEEVTHAFFYDLPEYKVRKFSAQLGRVIYSLFLKKWIFIRNDTKQV